MKARTPEENAAHQRDLRAKRTQKEILPVAPRGAEAVRPVTPERVEEVLDAFFPKSVFVVEKGKVVEVREYKGVSGYHYLPGDEVIGNMTQRQRDLIMAKLPKTNARTR